MAFTACEAKMTAAQKIAEALPPLPRGGKSEGRGFRGIGEPTLTEILQDPTLASLLASDGVQRDHLLDLIQAVRSKLAF